MSTSSIPLVKRCTKCGEEKPIALFRRQSNQCRECYNLARRIRHTENREHENLTSQIWRERNAERISEYKRNQRKIKTDELRLYEKGYREANREKRRMWQMEWKKANPDYAREHRAANHEKYLAYDHKRRANRATLSGYFTDQDIANMRYIQQGHCAYCGRVGLKLEIEHIIPVTRIGSSNDPWNLCLACRKCNASKNDRTIEEWFRAGRWFD